LDKLPKDLYIPDDALELLLDVFTGPLDLLLYLIRKQQINVLDIPVAEVAQQYQRYLFCMRVLQIEWAADYLLMVSVLTEIKSRLLLPKPIRLDDQEEPDPRANLVQRLQNYERIKQAAFMLDQLPHYYRDVFPVRIKVTDIPQVRLKKPKLEIEYLTHAWARVLMGTALKTTHTLTLESYSITEKMVQILQCLQQNQTEISLDVLLSRDEGRQGVIVTFIALLELYRQSQILLLQTESFGSIRIRPL